MMNENESKEQNGEFPRERQELANQADVGNARESLVQAPRILDANEREPQTLPEPPYASAANPESPSGSTPVPPPSILPDGYESRPASNQAFPTYSQNRENHASQDLFTPAQPINDVPPYSDDQRRARSFMFAAQITAIISLFFGGIVLGSVSIVLAFVSYSKVNKLPANTTLDADRRASLRRISMVTIAMCALALALNVAALIYIYPMVSEYLQTGDANALLQNLGIGDAQSTDGTQGSQGSVWG